MDTISYAKSSSAYKLASLVNVALGSKAETNGDSILVPTGTTATRPVLGAGESAIRYNSDVGGLEEWNGSEWRNVSASISAVSLKGTDTEANILAMVGMVAEDLWIASDTLHGWVYDGSAWIDVGPLQGPQGVQGVAGKSAYAVAVEGGFVGTEAQWLASLVGPTGATGNGIVSVVKTGTVGLVDTYTVTMTNGSTADFTVTNGVDGVDGNDVDHIAQTSGTGAAGTVDVYTVWGDVAETVNLGTFNVYNGADGEGAGDMAMAVYDTNNSGVVDNAEKVNGLTVETAVPIGALFTDTVYDDTAITTALGNKQDTLISGTNIKTVNNISILGSGDITTPTTAVNDTLTSTSTTEALTANQGKVLKELVDTKQDILASGTSIKTINSTTILGSGNLNLATTDASSLTSGILNSNCIPNATSTAVGGVKARLNGTTAYFTINGTTA